MYDWGVGRYLGFILLAVLGVYGASVTYDFVTLDDGPLIFQNPLVQEFSLRNISKAFTSYDPELYVPLTIFSYQVEHLLFGNNPAIYHLTNLVLHIANVLLVTWLAFLLGKRLAVSGERLAMFSLTCGGLFALHPINTEVVMWAAARKDLLSAFFFLLSVVLYLLYCSRDSIIADPDSQRFSNRCYGRGRFYWGSVGAFLFGLLSKVSIVTLPFVLLLIDWMEGSLSTWERVRERALEKLPYFALSTIFFTIALFGKSRELASIGTWEKALLSAKASVFYLWKMLWPTNLSVIHPQEGAVAFGSSEFWVPIFFLCILGFIFLFCLRTRTRTPNLVLPHIFIFVILWYFLLLLPSFATFWKHGMLFFASERYVYLSSIGVFMGIGFGFGFVRRNSHFTILILTLILILSVLSYNQSLTWRNGIDLYERVLAVYPHNALAHNNLAMTLYKKGEHESALVHLNTAIEHDAHSPRIYANRGLVLLALGRKEDALESAKKGTKSLPDDRQLLSDDLMTFFLLANLLEERGDIDGMFAALEGAREHGPEFFDAHFNLGLKLQQYGQTEDAINAYISATDINPYHRDAHYNLAGLLAESGRLADAVRHLKYVLAIDPTHQKARGHLKNLQRIVK
jgi:protein O-mannosyl-transferase